MRNTPDTGLLGSRNAISRPNASWPTDDVRAGAPPRVKSCRAARGLLALQLEQPRCICTGGHLTEPYEQNTQQSPAFGRSMVLQRSHS
jgi:hypothetical protein